MSGSNIYNVTINGMKQSVNSNTFETELSRGLNIIRVDTDLECQGFVEKEVFISEDIHYYPNPNVSKFMDRLRLTYEQFNKRPIWITEFAVADWSAAKDEDNRHSQEVVLEFMKEI